MIRHSYPTERFSPRKRLSTLYTFWWRPISAVQVFLRPVHYRANVGCLNCDVARQIEQHLVFDGAEAKLCLQFGRDALTHLSHGNRN
jgi:hypothetical protein